MAFFAMIMQQNTRDLLQEVKVAESVQEMRLFSSDGERLYFTSKSNDRA